MPRRWNPSLCIRDSRTTVSTKSMTLRTVTPQKVGGSAQSHQLSQGKEQHLKCVSLLKITPRSLQTAGGDAFSQGTIICT